MQARQFEKKYLPIEDIEKEPGKRVECLKVNGEIFEIGDIVEIPHRDITGNHIAKGRIHAFEEYGQGVPRDIGLILDISVDYHTKFIRLNVKDITKCKKIEEVI